MKDVDKMSDEEFIENVKYGIIVVRQDSEDPDFADILHFVGYVEEPTQADFNSIRQELLENKEFGLQDILDECDIISAPPEIVSMYVNTVFGK